MFQDRNLVCVTCIHLESSSHMETSDQRSQWEQSFQNFVSPVLKVVGYGCFLVQIFTRILFQNMEQTVKIAMSSILSDDKKGDFSLLSQFFFTTL